MNEKNKKRKKKEKKKFFIFFLHCRSIDDNDDIMRFCHFISTNNE